MLRTPLITALFVALVGCGKPEPQTTRALAKRLPLEIVTTTLPNGLRVIVQEDTRQPVVAVDVVYDVGSRDDPPSKRGFAHLFEHLMFEGTKHVQPQEHQRALERAGATHVNGTTTVDSTSYYEVVPSEQLDLALYLESDRMGFLLDTLDQKRFDGARAVVEKELEERQGQMDSQALASALFPATHPYHHLPIGDREELRAATLADVRAFWMRWYAPNNATIVLVGDVRPSEAFARVGKWFGDIPRGPAIERWNPGDPPRLANDAHATVVRPGPTKLLVGWTAPRLGAPGELEVMAGMMHTLTIARRRLVGEKGLATAVRPIHTPGELCTTIGLDVSLTGSATEKQVMEEIDVAVDATSKFLIHRATGTDMKKELDPLYAKAVFAADAVLSRARMFAQFDKTFGTPQAFVDRLARSETIDTDAVEEAFGQWIVRAHRAVVWAGAGS